MFPIILALLTLLRTSRALYPSNSNVINLTPTNFDQKVINSEQVWIVEFYAPWCGHCQHFAPEYQKAADALKGVVKVGAVNADIYKELSTRFKLRGYPTVKIFGDNKNSPEDFTGARTAEGLVEAALATARNKVIKKLRAKTAGSEDVIELNDSNFDRLVMESKDLWLVEFFAPWCGHCKNLAPHWAKAASELKGKIKVGALDVTANKMKAIKFKIEKYPTIKLILPGGKKEHIVDYSGGRTSEEIVNWALEKLAENLPKPEIRQVVSNETFDEFCLRKPLCVVSVLPHILDCQSKCRNNYLGILSNVSEKFKDKFWGWVWIEGGVQIDLEDALEIGGFGYPSLSAVNPKKMKHSPLKGSFSEKSIYGFLRDLSYGRGNTVSIKEGALPGIVETDVWDGKDAEVPVDEEEDLSSVVLDEL